MQEEYQILSKKDSKELTKYLAQNGQMLLPILELIQNARTAVDEVIDVVGRSTLEAILLLSARQVAGVAHKGKSTGPIRWHGSQPGSSLCPTGSCELPGPACDGKGWEIIWRWKSRPIRPCRPIIGFRNAF